MSLPNLPLHLNSAGPEVPVEMVSRSEAAYYNDLDVDCSTCVGGCCLKNIVMPLTERAAAFLRSGGTILKKVEEPHRRHFRHSELGKYKLETNCGFLVRDEEAGQMICSVYNDPERPEICHDFPVGGYHCREIRANNNVQPDEQQKFNEWLSRTGQC